MDYLDQEIFIYLDAQGLSDTNKLANKYGVSQRTVMRRINNMLKSNMIKVIATPNIVLLDYKAWARIGIRVNMGHLGKVTRTLVNHPLVYLVAHTLGAFDIILSTRLNTVHDLASFVNLELTHIEGVSAIETMLLVSPRRYNQFRWPKKIMKTEQMLNESSQNTEGQRYYLDEIERKILNILVGEGPCKVKELALKINESENKIRRRLKSMWKNEVYKLEVIPIADILQYETQATIGITIGHQYPDVILDKLAEHPSVFLASASLGHYNIILGARFRRLELLNEFVTKTLPSIPGISSTETFLHVKRLKYNNITWL